MIDQIPLSTPLEIDGKRLGILTQPAWSKVLNQIVATVNDLLASTGYVIVNVTPLRAYDVNTVTLPQVANTLGTLIADLQSKGILS